MTQRNKNFFSVNIFFLFSIYSIYYDLILCLQLISYQLLLKIALKPRFLFVAFILQHSNKLRCIKCLAKAHILSFFMGIWRILSVILLEIINFLLKHRNTVFFISAVNINIRLWATLSKESNNATFWWKNNLYNSMNLKIFPPPTLSYT